jgi:hypothetical protein
MSKTDERIVAWIRESIGQGSDLNIGSEIEGRIPESGEFYGGAERGMVQFSHVVTAQDIEDAARISASEVQQ